ncbi:hypothetical protein BS50DRAFT_582478 [Corynespora cassiicola Philippines]|uniref:Endosomal peripheral membrane protein-like protein n=1 Tax=Corynespora cassiicola Philippines TaxID=1448308 RepID=A0A2T2P5A5_CORCC|nr:hypothetical protein BS50DRAFT_582478 [Corynespora cassiicola Philippines]
MTSQILAAELGNLIQDSKRKNSELRSAAEKALSDLKSLPNTSEAQLSADLSRRPHFITPFLIACGTHNAKFASTGVSCLQRLSVSRALPRDRLTEVLDGLKESIPLSHDVQLKILQALPSLLQNYAGEIRGDLLFSTLQICSALQNTKNFAVSNTAAATLQQLIITVFDRVASEDEKALEIPTVAEVTADGGPTPVRPAAHDAYKVFNDLNLLVTGEKPSFVRFSSLPSTATLELIEAVLSNHGKIMTTHDEQIHLLRSLLMPTIIRSLSDRLSFPVTLRIIRILNLLIRNHLNILPSECEIALGLLNHMLDPEASSLWKRALCLEVFRGIYSDSRLVLEIYSHFDEQEGKRCIFGDNLAAFVRLATEKPALIGLGQGSTVPAGRGDGKDVASEQAVAEAGALAGVIGGPASEPTSTGHPSGISTQWSSLKTPCIEHLDKSEPPALPETYVYSLVLTCITNVSESLAKFVLPLTVHHDNKNRKKARTEDLAEADSEPSSPTPGKRRLSRTQSFRKKTIPVNPLSLSEHPAHDYIQTSAALVTECWPAVLATCSTFLNAALDSDYYRALVRAIQKFTQVAGLLRLSTPRDAFLTTMGKAAVPANLLISNISSPKSSAPENTGVFSNAKGLLSVDSLVSQASASLEKNRRPSHDIGTPTLGPRNLLCLRALLNLAIALGPTLQSAWSIVFETLQVADLVMALSNSGGIRTPGGSVRGDQEQSSEKVEAETSAVQAAARRLFESTVDFPNESFVEVLQALCALLHSGVTAESGQRTPSTSTKPQALHQRRMGSVSGISLTTETNSRDSAFALNKIGELAGLNEARLSHYDPEDSGWDVFVAELVRFAADDHNAASTRLLSADVVARTVREIAELSMSDEERDEVQTRILSALRQLISALYVSPDGHEQVYADTEMRIHQIALDALKSVIEQCGESLVAGWGSVFDSLLSVFSPSASQTGKKGETLVNPNGYLGQSGDTVEVISRQLARSAFGTVQLVCSDFLAAVPDICLSTLLELLLRFSLQQEDLNMSLTTITFFWNVSDFLQARSDLSTLPEILGNAKQQDEIYRTVRSHSEKGTIPTLWLQVLMNLSAITTDRRAELRNSAVQTIQRIFESYVDQLSSDAWMLCLRTVLFGMVQSNLNAQRSIREGSQSLPEDAGSWNETTKTALDSVSTLISMYMDKVEDASRLGEAWSDLLDYLQQYFECGSHALGSSVFTTITGVLSRVEDAKILGQQPLLKTATVWKGYFDHREAWKTASEGNQEAFVAYAEAFKSIYRLSQGSLDSDLPSMLVNLEACVVDSDAVAYSSDVDHMTPLQTQVMECLQLVRSESPGLPTFLIQLLSRFIVLPYTSVAENPEKSSPTFVALSKASMSALQTISTKHISEGDIYTSGAFLSALQSLSKPIQEKYIWQREGRAPTLWQKATTTSLAILEPGLSNMKNQDLAKGATNSIWEQVVTIATSIISAPVPVPPPPSVSKDESFDIEAFTHLRTLITISLGSPSLPDSLRRTYTRNLFTTSLIHAPSPGEIPALTTAPLQDLYRIRPGATATPPPRIRTEMAYICLLELVTLVSAHDSSPPRIKLAQAAAPYLILRAALPLRAYIADHPLRGRMPAPESLRRELLCVIGELKRLRSEPMAIPEAPGVRSRFAKHLHRLYPLLTQAMGVGRRDWEVFGGLEGLVERVGRGFGVEEKGEE